MMKKIISLTLLAMMLVVFLCSCTSSTPDTFYKVSETEKGLVLNAETEIPGLDLIDRIEEEIRYFTAVDGTIETLLYVTPRAKINKAGLTTYTEIELRENILVSHTVTIYYISGETKAYSKIFNSLGNDALK